jgi:hypothetical protein
MKAKTLLILAGAVLMLGAFIWFFERHEPTSDEARTRETQVFGGLDQQDIQTLDITNSHGVFTIERAGEGWRLTQPIEADADQTAVDTAIRGLLGLKIDRALPSADVSPEAYGLDTPEATVTLTSQNGEKYTLAVGNPTPLGAKRSVSLDPKSILLTGGSFFPAIDKGLDDWRSRRVADIRLDQLAALSIQTENGTIKANTLGDQWQLHSPVNDRADREHLQNVISGLNALRIEEFVDDGGDEAAMGLVRPSTSVLLVRADGLPGLSLEFGATREQGGATQIACRRNTADVFWVNDRAETPLGMAPIRWRDPKVLAFDTWDVAALALSDSTTSVKLNKEGGLWQFEDGGEVRGDEVLKRLGVLSDLKAINFDLVNLGTDEMGRAVITLNGGTSPITCTFFKPFEAGGNVLVSVSDRATFMSVAPDDAQSIIGNLEALRSDETPGDLPEDSESETTDPVKEVKTSD